MLGEGHPYTSTTLELTREHIYIEVVNIPTSVLEERMRKMSKEWFRFL
jgi:hypothetical protein